MANRSLFEPVDMSTVLTVNTIKIVPPFYSTAPTTFFLLQHSRCSRFPIGPQYWTHWTPLDHLYKCHIKQNSLEKKQLEARVIH